MKSLRNKIEDRASYDIYDQEIYLGLSEMIKYVNHYIYLNLGDQIWLELYAQAKK